MNRRKLLVLFGTSPFALSLVAHAQPAQDIPRIGYLVSQTPDLYFDAFQQRLSELGYVNGKNVSIDLRNAEGNLEQIPALVLELVHSKVNVLVVPNVVAINAARKYAAAIPTVMISSIDPIKAGFAVSLARPGGNITGIATLQRDLSAKRLEAIRDVFPKLSRLAILWDANGPGPKVAFTEYAAAAKMLKWRVQSLAIRGSKAEFEAAFRAAAKEKAEAIMAIGNPLFNAHRSAIVALSTRYRIPLFAETEGWTRDGALLAYGSNLTEMGRRLADFVHRILQGAKPADLPIEQPTTFELVVNMKTAKALGITFPPSILVRVNKVIE